MVDKFVPDIHMSCYLCGSTRADRVQGKVRDRPEIPILLCRDCGLVYLGDFSHVHESFYAADYTSENHGEQGWQTYLNECRRDDERRFMQLSPVLENHRYLDVGCGGGGVLRLAQPHCAAVKGVEPQGRWRELLQAAGIDVVESLRDVAANSYDVVSLFHVLEHIPDPLAFLNEVLAKVASGGQVVIEVPNADDALITFYRCRPFCEFTYWSPHLFLYNLATIRRLLEKAGVARERFAIHQFQRYPLSNHLCWLAEGRPGGHISWSFLDSPALHQAYTAQLAAMGCCDTLMVWIRA